MKPSVGQSLNFRL